MDWDIEMSLKNVACFGLFATSVRACDVVCPLDTAAVTEFNGGLICFLALLPRSFVLVRCLREANVAIFCGRSNQE